METIILIPARLESSRLRKKLINTIGPKSMLSHVVDRAKESKINNIIVATDSAEIISSVKETGVDCIMTSKEHESGSDRIYEALSKEDPQKNKQCVINLQGDIPFIDPEVINALYDKFLESNVDIMTLASPIDRKDISKISNRNVTKVAISFYGEGKSCGKAVYFSREPISSESSIYYEHIGIYIYKRSALEKFVNAPTNDLEKHENLEQLRALANGMSIDVHVISSPPVNVDTPESLEKAKEEYKKKYSSISVES